MIGSMRVFQGIIGRKKHRLMLCYYYVILFNVMLLMVIFSKFVK